jgi:hypothetical protein
MEKIHISFKVPYTVEWSYGIEISKIRQDLDAIEKLGGTHIDIHSSDSYPEYDAFYRRIETDDEFNARKADFDRKKEELKIKELRELERLKNKYGK